MVLKIYDFLYVNPRNIEVFEVKEGDDKCYSLRVRINGSHNFLLKESVSGSEKVIEIIKNKFLKGLAADITKGGVWIDLIEEMELAIKNETEQKS